MDSPCDTPAAGRFVLVVDDEPLLRCLLKVALLSAGYTVETAVDGPHALRLLRTGPLPALIVWDPELPALGRPALEGSGFGEALMQTPELAEIPLLLCTGARPPASAPWLAGCPCLEKPFTLDGLFAAVAGALRNAVDGQHVLGSTKGVDWEHRIW